MITAIGLNPFCRIEKMFRAPAKVTVVIEKEGNARERQEKEKIIRTRWSRSRTSGGQTCQQREQE